ncbi:hypothetical protein LXL04_032474 [Taraxacum kok-saghyz]
MSNSFRGKRGKLISFIKGSGSRFASRFYITVYHGVNQDIVSKTIAHRYHPQSDEFRRRWRITRNKALSPQIKLVSDGNVRPRCTRLQPLSPVSKQPAINVLKEIRDFLKNNPTEIITIITEDYVTSQNGLTNVFNNVGLRKFRFPVNRMPSNGAEWPMVDFLTLDCKGKMDKYSEDYLGYLASFEDLYEEILQAMLKLDAKIKYANDKFIIILIINNDF